MMHSKLKSPLCKILFVSSLFLVLDRATLVSANKNCADDCANMLYGGSVCDGTAPTCEGDNTESPSSMEDYWMNGESPVISNGKCSSGEGCWTGNKRCTCFKDYSSCSSTCDSYPVHPDYTDNVLIGSWESKDVPDGYNKKTAQTPAASVSGSLKITYCWCLYAPVDAWSKITGTWANEGSANGEASIVTSITWGTSSTDEASTTNEWSTEFTETVSTGFEYEGVEASVEVSGTVAESTSKTISSATTTSMERTCEVDCPSPNSLDSGVNYVTLWQWQMNGYHDDVQTTTVASCNFHCIYSVTSSSQPPLCAPTDCYDADCQTCVSDQRRLESGKDDETESRDGIFGIQVRNGKDIQFSNNFPTGAREKVLEWLHKREQNVSADDNNSNKKTSLRNKH